MRPEINEENPAADIKRPWIGPLKLILALSLILLILIAIIPYTSLRLDPEPKNIPSLEIIPKDIGLRNSTLQINELNDFKKLIDPTDPVIKQIAVKIASQSCDDSNQICHAKAIYYFVQANFGYVSDPIKKEYIEHPRESLFSGAMDCDGHAILLSSLMESIGINSELVFITGHVFVRIELEQARKKYRRGNWVYLDSTCKTCNFGEIPVSDLNKEEYYLEVP